MPENVCCGIRTRHICATNSVCNTSTMVPYRPAALLRKIDLVFMKLAWNVAHSNLMQAVCKYKLSSMEFSNPSCPSREANRVCFHQSQTSHPLLAPCNRSSSMSSSNGLIFIPCCVMWLKFTAYTNGANNTFFSFVNTEASFPLCNVFYGKYMLMCFCIHSATNAHTRKMTATPRSCPASPQCLPISAWALLPLCAAVSHVKHQIKGCWWNLNSKCSVLKHFDFIVTLAIVKYAYLLDVTMLDLIFYLACFDVSCQMHTELIFWGLKWNYPNSKLC